MVAAVGVHEFEFRIGLTRSSVPAGAVLVELDNKGEDAHDLHLRRADGSGPQYSFVVGRPGARDTQTVKLSAGAWRLWCGLPGHDAAGMHATLMVVGSDAGVARAG